jgi:hypothetical protein
MLVEVVSTRRIPDENDQFHWETTSNAIAIVGTGATGAESEEDFARKVAVIFDRLLFWESTLRPSVRHLQEVCMKRMHRDA